MSKFHAFRYAQAGIDLVLEDMDEIYKKMN